MEDAVNRLIVWHQEEIKRLTTLLSVRVLRVADVKPAEAEAEPAVADVEPVMAEADDEPTEHLYDGTTQQPYYHSPLSSWDGGNDTAPVSPAPLSPDMFASQTAWPEVPETQPLPRRDTFVEILDMLASDDDEPTQ